MTPYDPHHRPSALLLSTLLALCLFAARAQGDAPPPRNDYPTLARVEYVQSCLSKTGETLAGLYKCACAIDRIAAKLTYDDYVEASTFAKYSGLGGPNAGIFRDTDQAKNLAKMYRTLEADAYRFCNLPAEAKP